MPRRTNSSLSDSNVPLKRIAQQILEKAKAEVKFSGRMDDEIDETLNQVIDRELPALSTPMYEYLVEDIPAHTAWRRKYEHGFRRRNLQRWRAALNCLEAEWAIVQEAGEAFYAEERAAAIASDDYLF